MSKLPDVFGALVSDGLELFDVIGGSTAGAILSSGVKGYLERQKAKAREILLDELARGEILPPQASAEEEKVAVVYHYFRSACIGAARINLRLIAKGIVGRLTTNTLVADEFLPHADALAALSRDEIILLATMYLIRGTIGLETDKLKFSSWVGTLNKLQESGWQTERAEAAAGRALRSGYVIAGWRTSEMVYRLSPLLIDLCKTVDFDDALRRETKDAASEQPPA